MACLHAFQHEVSILLLLLLLLLLRIDLSKKDETLVFKKWVRGEERRVGKVASIQFSHHYLYQSGDR